MTKNTLKHKDFIQKYAEKMKCKEEVANDFLAGFMDTIFDAMKERESVTLENFGKFYIEDKRDSTVFKFNPAQKFKAILGWSNTYKGEI